MKMSVVRHKIAIERMPGLMASVYEKAARMVIGSYYGQVADEIVSRLKSGMVLDLGTGPGYLPIEIVKRAPDIRVVGIDLSAKLIKMAEENAERGGVADKLHFEVGDAARLRFGDNSYDMVFSTGMLHSLKEPVRVIEECRRVLKPSGEAWIYDPAKVCSIMDVGKWKASLTLWEKFLYKVFTVYRLVNPTHAYNREQISHLAATSFEKYWIEESGNEIKVKLRK